MPVTRRSVRVSALIVALSAIVGSLIPLDSFLFLPVKLTIVVALIISALTIFSIGAFKSRATTVGRPARSGMELALIGVLSALVGYSSG